MRITVSKSTIVFSIALIWAVLSANVANAAEYYVDHLEDSSTATACQHLVHPDCSLRGAIMKANANPGDDVIRLVSNGTYTLTLVGSGEEGGDLDITDDLTIHGTHPGSKIIDASGITGGGRVLDIEADVTVTVTGVSITGGSAGFGGGIYNFGTLNLEKVWVSNNEATISGGGVFNGGTGTLNITDSYVTSNDTVGEGGGIYSRGGVAIYDSCVAANISTRDGGGMFNHADGYVLIRRSLFSDNLVFDTGGSSGYTLSGGAIHNDGWVNAYNSTFYQNKALDGSGGAIASDDGRLTLTHLTFTRNESPSGSALRGNSGSDIVLANSIIAGTCDLGQSPFTSNGGNIESPGHSCPLNLSDDATDIADPMFGDYGYSGGAVWSFALQPESPAIDFGDYLSGEPVDQRGRPRPVDGDGDSVPAYDSGAYEYNPAEVFIDGFESGGVGFWSSYASGS